MRCDTSIKRRLPICASALAAQISPNLASTGPATALRYLGDTLWTLAVPSYPPSHTTRLSSTTRVYAKPSASPPLGAIPSSPFSPTSSPPLLAIPSESLAIQARTHRSSRTVAYVKADARKIRATAYDRELASYEVLESLGDRRINVMVYAVLNFHFPFMISAALSVRCIPPSSSYCLSDRPSNASRRTSQRGCSATLHSPTSRRPTRFPPTLIFGCVGEPDRDQAIAADMFEAHVGAFVRWEMDTGTSSGIDDWLKRLFDPAVWCGVSETAHGLAEAARTLRLKKPKSVPVECVSLPSVPAFLADRETVHIFNTVHSLVEVVLRPL